MITVCVFVTVAGQVAVGADRPGLPVGLLEQAAAVGRGEARTAAVPGRVA